MILIVCLVLISFLFSYFKSTKQTNTISINTKVFKIEVAKTQQQKEIGLAKFKNISEDFGMYFPFSTPDYYAFWMKDMKFPIDIIYIYKNKIVDIFKEVKNPKNNREKLKIYKPTSLSDSVLEINAGLTGKYNFKKGDSVRIDIK